MFFVYILKSDKNGSYYIGSCKDLEKRLNYHNNGLVPSTKRYLPWTLKLSESYQTLREARKREFKLKSWKSRDVVEKLIKKFQNCS